MVKCVCRHCEGRWSQWVLEHDALARTRCLWVLKSPQHVLRVRPDTPVLELHAFELFSLLDQNGWRLQILPLKSRRAALPPHKADEEQVYYLRIKNETVTKNERLYLAALARLPELFAKGLSKMLPLMDAPYYEYVHEHACEPPSKARKRKALAIMDDPTGGLCAIEDHVAPKQKAKAHAKAKTNAKTTGRKRKRRAVEAIAAIGWVAGEDDHDEEEEEEIEEEGAELEDEDEEEEAGSDGGSDVGGGGGGDPPPSPGGVGRSGGEVLVCRLAPRSPIPAPVPSPHSSKHGQQGA